MDKDAIEETTIPAELSAEVKKTVDDALQQVREIGNMPQAMMIAIIINPDHNGGTGIWAALPHGMPTEALKEVTNVLIEAAERRDLVRAALSEASKN